MSRESMESGLESPRIYLPAVMARNEKTVRDGFWRKMARVAGKVPFAEDAATAWFCVADRDTPTHVKAVLLAALTYFVLPFDVVPDWIAGLGFTDDAAVIAMAFRMVSSSIRPRHRADARKALGLPPTEKPKS